MEMNVQKWVRLARGIGKGLLNGEGKQMDDEVSEWAKESDRGKRILDELKDLDFYVEKEAKKREIEKCYSWEEFMTWRRRYERRRKLLVVRCVAAVAILFLVSTCVWFVNRGGEESQFMFPSEIKPGSLRASLILNDGQEIMLDKRLSLMESDSSVVLSNEKGELSYRNVRERAGESSVNTLRVPCGGEYQLMLADGTRVRVNSESELVFPTCFNSDRREVFLKGEAYFQVAPDSDKPFYVRVNDYIVKVTGTSFNVTSYTDDPCAMTTLVEGKVSVYGNDSTWNCDLTPGHMLKFDKGTARVTSEECDPRIYISWIDGEFKFRDMRLEDIMKKLNRWYDFEVAYEEEELKDLRFSGAAEKYNPVEFLLKMIEEVTKVHFDIEGKRIMVKNN
ncbi:FecR family protein [Butyricimonas virosa]|uniref:FecR family protein n=1 Tax=Butyricimonas virosa TaxID=544645 RepID=UPI0024312A7B|nr:FecR domain-containing protein [Butyricimonas virosa]